MHKYKDASCPALGKTCTACSKPNHFASYCTISKRLKQFNTTPKQSVSLSTNVLFAAERKQILKTSIELLHPDGSTVKYEALIDTGSDITTISKALFDKFSYYGNYMKTNEKSQILTTLRSTI